MKPGHSTAILRWMIFILLSNVILFLPITLAYLPMSGWTPWGGIANVATEGRLSVFFLNHNYNPFRLQAEWTIAVLLVMSIHWRFPGNRWTIALLAPIYVVILLFQIYYAVMHWIYGETPSFTNEFILIREVLPVYLAGNGIPNVLVWSGLFVFLAILLWLANVMARRGVQTGTVLLHFTEGRIVLALIPVFIAISSYRYAKADPHDLRLNSQWVYPRIQDAFHVSTEDPLGRLEERSAVYQTWMKDKVQDLPNIYLIFIESYGAVAHLSSYVQEPFQATLKQLEDSLRADGWNSRSAYSLAPIKGGRSWLSFTSALLGVKIRNQVDYNRLYHLTFQYPHLIRYLNELGYTTHRINTMQTNEQTDALIPYESVAAFHEFDDWVLFPDIPYQGYRYNSIGGIPDQYSLEHVWSSRIKGDSSPHMVFFITLDSHAPWFPPPPVAHLHKDLDTIRASPYGTDRSLDADIMDRYLATMEYEWTFLSHFIRRHANERDLFILVGDHQPPAMEHQIWDQINDYAVPLHVLAKSRNIDDFLASNQFQTGLIPAVPDSVQWQHQGIFSLIRSLIVVQDSTRQAPAKIQVFPEGI